VTSPLARVLVDAERRLAEAEAELSAQIPEPTGEVPSIEDADQGGSPVGVKEDSDRVLQPPR
jgi:hypothetical protein